MITKLILRFDNLSDKELNKIADWLLVTTPSDKPFKLFKHQGGVNNKMEEIKNE